MCMDIQLVEALCGFQKPISTLDNRTIVITSHPGQIVKHGDIKCVLNEGMPIYHRPYEKGRLIIEFKYSLKEMKKWREGDNEISMCKDKAIKAAYSLKISFFCFLNQVQTFHLDVSELLECESTSI
ncbi:hypothetical protein GH733_015241 [Mirounga leonina]|nr:hypothetical protein GH733_015241 [Mirounga leonina]